MSQLIETIHEIDDKKFKELSPKWAHYAIAECPPGWYFIVYVMLKKFEFLEKKGLMEDFVVMQIKEKFSGLRFYWSGSPESKDLNMDGEVLNLEEQADKICMNCGSVTYIDDTYVDNCKNCEKRNVKYK